METSNNRALPVPSVNSVYGYGWDIMKKNFVNLLLIVIILIAAQMVTGIWNQGGEPSALGGLLSLAFWLLVLGPIQYGAIYLFLKTVRGESYDLAQIFDGFKTNYKEIILANLLTTLLVVIGFALLIIPGIILACRLAFVPYLVMDQKMEAIKALEKSWQMTKGYGWTIFLIGFLAIFIFLAGFIVFIVGVIIAMMWVYASFSAMYYAVELEAGKNAEPVANS